MDKGLRRARHSSNSLTIAGGCRRYWSRVIRHAQKVDGAQNPSGTTMELISARNVARDIRSVRKVLPEGIVPFLLAQSQGEKATRHVSVFCHTPSGIPGKMTVG